MGNSRGQGRLKMILVRAAAGTFASSAALAENAAMRIIAGEFRGRRLLPPKGQTTRPITDRVKQSLFDVLAPLLPDARIYDCFAGTGSLGLESLSRGATHVTFFEADRSAVALLGRNIAAFNMGNRSAVISADVFKWFATEPAIEKRVDVAFLDPPYRFLRERRDELRQLAGRMVELHLARDGTIVFRHDSADHLVLSGTVVRERREYGSMILELLGREGA